MATAPLPTPEAIKDAPTVIKIPNTLIMDKDGSMAREWIYFFNDISRAVDQQITANLPELTQKLLDSVADIIRLDEDTASTNLELAYAMNDIAINRSDIATNTLGLSTANGKISANATGLATANTAITNQSGLISGLTTRLDSKDTEVSTLQSTTATNTDAISSLQLQLQTQADAMTALEARVAALEAAP